MKRKIVSLIAWPSMCIMLMLLSGEAYSQITLSQDTLVIEPGVLNFNRNLANEPEQIDMLRSAIVSEFDHANHSYKALNNSFAINRGWIKDSKKTSETIQLVPESSAAGNNDRFSIHLKKITYDECGRLINDTSSISRFDGVWLNDQQLNLTVPGDVAKPACIREWPLQAGKNSLRYAAH